jgi:soluble lytic murein transglycosylase
MDSPRFSPLVVLVAITSFAGPVCAQPVTAESTAMQVREGEFSAARATLMALRPRTAEQSYLLGRLWERESDSAQALIAYAAIDLATFPPEVADDLRIRRGRLELATGDAAAAEATLSGMAQPGRVSRGLLAECAAARGELELAERRLRTSIAEERDDTDGFALQLLLAEVLVAARRPEDAIETLRALVIARPEHVDDESAWAAARGIAGHDLELSLTDRLTRIDRLSERHQHERALTECTGLTLPERGAERAEALHIVGMAHYRARREDEAHELLAEAARLGGPHEAEDAFHAARALHRRSADRQGVRLLRAFVRAHPGHRLAREAEYLAAATELDLDPTRGRRSLATFITHHRVGDYAREAGFRLAMDAFDRHRWDDATRRLGALEGSEDGLERLRIRYWQARVLEERGRWPLARTAFVALIAESPLHYYSLLSRQRLLAHDEPDPAPFPDRAVSATPEASITWPAAATFYRTLGLDADAARILRDGERELRRLHGLRAMVEAYAAVGDHERAYRLVASSELLDSPLTDETAWIWRAAYPEAFERSVRSAATEMDIEPELIWAVMRQESAYSPGVVSISDAIGLMQMLPGTGARVAERLGVRFRRALLFDPRFNIRFGARYLATLVELVGVPAAFAAYNAGEHRVEQWWAAPACRGEWAMDRFVDWIPFSQTRGYVRRVTSHYLRYRYLRDPDAGWPDVTLAETAGAGRACERP